jgi:hypothetical protein
MMVNYAWVHTPVGFGWRGFSLASIVLCKAVARLREALNYNQ